MSNRATLFVCLASLAVAAPVSAADTPYFGFKVGLMDPEPSGLDKPVNVGAAIGFYFFDDSRGSLAGEGEATASVKNGDKDGGGDWKADTVAAYLAYRTVGDGFLKAKAGVAQQNIGGTPAIGDRTGFSFGFGLGYRMTRKASLELEYTVFDDLHFISLGFYSHF